MEPSKKILLPIKGMHCKSCELVIERNVSKIEHVKKVNAHYGKGITEVYFDDAKPDYAKLEQAILAAGYAVGVDEKKLFFSRDLKNYFELSLVLSLLFFLYIVVSLSGILESNFQFSSSPSLLVVLLIGLTAGVSTCMAVIGGLVLGISSNHAQAHPEATRIEKFRPHLFFNAGRIISYALLGGVIGWLGSAFTLSPWLLGLLIIAAGAYMLLLGLQLIEIFPKLSNWKFTLPTSLARLFGIQRETKEYSHKGAFITGAATFFLPCGFTQAMQLYAVSTRSFSQGALIMALFALGTTPGLLGLAGVTSIVKGQGAQLFFKFVGVAVIVLGIINIGNGYNLTGFTVAQSSSDPSVAVSNTNAPAQVIRMDQTPGGYKPSQFTVKKGVPVRWIINGTNPFTCTSSMVVPALGVSKPITQGENVIEFTPKRTGTIKFSCAMGMYSGSINVIN